MLANGLTDIWKHQIPYLIAQFRPTCPKDPQNAELCESNLLPSQTSTCDVYLEIDQIKSPTSGVSWVVVICLRSNYLARLLLHCGGWCIWGFKEILVIVGYSLEHNEAFRCWLMRSWPSSSALQGVPNYNQQQWKKCHCCPKYVLYTWHIKVIHWSIQILSDGEEHNLLPFMRHTSVPRLDFGIAALFGANIEDRIE